MSIRHYIVDVFVPNDMITKDQLDTAIGNAIDIFNEKNGGDILEYDVVDMGVDTDIDFEEESE